MPALPPHAMQKARSRAKRLGVEVKRSANKAKKLDVYRRGEKVASIGDVRYSDFLQHGDEERRRRYKQRHEKHRHNVGTASYYADKLLW
jgi:hypothetical protein